jgi:uncharacterized protein YwbE
MDKLFILILVIFFSGCAHNAVTMPLDGHEALGSISRKGFALNKAQIQKLNGKVVKLWGYIDFANTSTCGRKNWYFSLKADKLSEAGESIHINTPAEYRFGELYYDIRDMQKRDQKTAVLVKGVLKTFNAPTNFATPIGIEIYVKSPEDIKFK